MINFIVVFCEVSGVDVCEVVWVIGIDSWIGLKFFNVGFGFGGSCF